MEKNIITLNPFSPTTKNQQRNQRRRERRQELKLENSPREELKSISSFPDKYRILSEIQDKLFSQFRPTFSTPVSRELWEKLKSQESFLLRHFVPDFTIRDIQELRRENLELLKQNPEHHCAGSLIFFIKTLVHRPKDIRKLTEEEKEWLVSFFLPPIERDENKMEKRREYYRKRAEYERELAKRKRERQKEYRVLSQLNRDFIAADPNKVLSLSDILDNPYMTNFSRREEFKVFLAKELKDSEKDYYFEKWMKERADYEKEVESLPEKYKREFLERMKDKCYFEEWEERKERYLNFHKK